MSTYPGGSGPAENPENHENAENRENRENAENRESSADSEYPTGREGEERPEATGRGEAGAEDASRRAEGEAELPAEGRAEGPATGEEARAERFGRAHDAQRKPRTPAEAKYAELNAEAAASGAVGVGAQRYADDPEEVPPSGSEESWSAEPKPGFQTDPVLKKHYSTRRLAVGAVVGVCVLGFAGWMGTKALASKSPNGNGSAPWTAAPRVDGAVVNGINAQNGIGNAAYNNGTAAAIVRGAATECADPINDPAAVAAGAGQAVALTGWNSVAGTTLAAIQQGAQSLNTAVVAQDVPKIAAASKAMCAAMVQARSLPPIADATATGAWRATIESYASAVKDSLAGAQGNMFQFNTAEAELANGQTALSALQSRLAAPG